MPLTASFGRTANRDGGPAPLAEHSMVTLSVPVPLEDGRTLPPGACGAIVFVHEGGEAYEVEFIEPFHAVATMLAPQLSRIPDV